MKNKKEELTSREIEVLTLLVRGVSNHKIAAQLCITDHTVKAHLTHTYKKLNVANRTLAVIKAKDNNLIPPQD